MTPKALVKGKSYAQAILLKELPFWRHASVFPWIPVYVLWASFAFFQEHIFEDGPLIALGAICFLHLLFYLLIYHWSIKLEGLCAYEKQAHPHASTHIFLAPSIGPSAIVPVSCIVNNTGNNKGVVRIWSFSHLEIAFLWDGDHFVKTSWPQSLQKHFPDILDEGRALHQGLGTGSLLKVSKTLYGKNSLHIPIPSFGSLFKEHAVAPFFVFQVVCVFLWMLDTYIFHSLMTLAMLVIFESTVVLQRLKNLKEIRGMASPPLRCMVKREDQSWIFISSEDLLPGDLAANASVSQIGDVVFSVLICVYVWKVSLLCGCVDLCLFVVLKDGSGQTVVPADMLLVHGSCIVNEALLSGESTPCMKESVSSESIESTPIKSLSKNGILYSGTSLLQMTSPDPSSSFSFSKEIPQESVLIGLVLRTGFLTTQGKLVRTMCLGRERLSANNKEAGYFLLFLLAFALVAAIYVWNHVLSEDPTKPRSHLLIQCLLIITAVVPPELPMELSIAVNASLMALSKLAIFCTEPFRLPLAGSIDVCCFDKTGTLTQSHLSVRGITGTLNEKGDDPAHLMPDMTASPSSCQLVIGTCHSLVLLNGEPAGDPLEVSSFCTIKWRLSKHPDRVTRPITNTSFHIRKRFPFMSVLKRMSVIVTNSGNNESFLTCKGAPEALHHLCKDPPDWYSSVAEDYARQGCRVIALAMKPISKYVNMDRSLAESSLEFVGFLVFGTTLKPEASKVVSLLKESLHKVVMITGDHVLTAMHVAKTLSLGSYDGNDSEYTLLDTLEEDESVLIQTNPTSPTKSIQKAHYTSTGRPVAITGSAFDVLKKEAIFLNGILPKVYVFARFSPSQKEDVLRMYKEIGWHTLMCGDGTNDVGALKQAHIGIALLDGTAEDLEKINVKMRQRAIKRRKEQILEFQKKIGAPINSNTKADVDDEEDDDVPILRFGDASVAAPFTSKIGTLESVCHILKQGRCTLATTHQMFKILALNSLIAAYSLSVLHLSGVRQSDFQMTVAGMLLAACFLFLSRSQPLKVISKDRPAMTIFTFYSICSILGQFAIHCVCLLIVMGTFGGDELPLISSEDFTFNPSLLNSSIYLLSLMMQISTFTINYQGPPFRESITENKGLCKSLLGVSILAWTCALEIVPELNEWLQIVPFPQSFKMTLVGLMAFDFVACYLIENILKYFFSSVSPRWKTSSSISK